MTSLSVTSLNSLVPVTPPGNVPALYHPAIQTPITLTRERQLTKVYVIEKLVRIWNETQMHVFRVTNTEDTSVETDIKARSAADAELCTAIRAFQDAIMMLQGMEKEQRAMFRHLEALRLVIDRQAKRRPFEADGRPAVSRRANRIRNICLDISANFERMRLKADTPGWLKRFFNRAWEQAGVTVSESDKQRIIQTVQGMLLGASTKLGEKIGIQPNVLEAFATFNLTIGSPSDEVETAYKRMIREVHTDLRTGEDPSVKAANEEQAKRLNNARVVLRSYFLTVGSQKNVTNRSDYK